MNMKEFFKKYTKQSKKGFTMVEMIAVIVIMSIISTATISVFLSVQTTVRDTSKLTTQQFSTTQTEKFIRNEFQTASVVDVHGVSSGLPDAEFIPEANDEFMYFEPTTQQVIFTSYDAAGKTHNKLTIDQVEDVQIDICPLDYTASATDNIPFKLIYKIQTASYTYSGGIVLGNSYVNDSETFVAAKTIFGGNVASLHWYMNPNGKDDSEKYNPPDNQNEFCVTFHSVGSQVTSTDT